MNPTQGASTYPTVPVGIAIEFPLSDLTRDEFEALFGADEEDTQPAPLLS